ncbi:hypothetical protein ACHAXT_010922 [Thalassiosira profunda]
MSEGAADPPPNAAKPGGQPGGLLGYFINRKKSHEHLGAPLPDATTTSENRSGRGDRRTRRYHEMVNTGGSFYLGALIDDSDSDDDNNPRKAVLGQTPASSGAPSSSWLASYQRSGQGSGEGTHESTSSWMSQAWRSMDSAKEWVLATSSSSSGDAPVPSSQTNPEGPSSWAMPPSLSNAVSSTLSSISSLNFFSDGEASSADAQSTMDNAAMLPTSAFLPKFASRFEWATRQRNPYQAVIGRGEADYLLAPRTAGVWGWFSWTSWLPWIANGWGSKMSIENGNGDNSNGTAEGGNGPRRGMKRQPSEASVQAVKNLLSLVQQQVALEDQNSGHGSNGDPPSMHRDPSQDKVDMSPVRTPLPAPRSPAPMSLDAPGESSPLPSFPDLKGDDTFDSEASGDPSIQATPARSSPAAAHRHDPLPESETRATFFSPVSKRPARSTFAHAKSSSGSGDANALRDSNDDSSSNNRAMHAEMAARLAEGTLRAYRDLALDEATELHSALHHWTVRWERPFLGWLEAGPRVWFSQEGYSPYLAGKKVSQTQAVLARRCAVIGEIQQHLWRSNWQKGVAEWGMLGGGVGGEWTSVVGEFGGMEGPAGGATTRKASSGKQQSHPEHKMMKIFNHSSMIGSNVSNKPGGSIVIDKDLTTWSIDAIRVIRDQLYRALPSSHGMQELPYVDHWPRERSFFRGEEEDANSSSDVDLPLWAEEVAPPPIDPNLSNASRAAAEAAGGKGGSSPAVVISDLPQMSNEVQSLLQSVEVHLEQQRARRLGRLRPPSRLRRNWYLVALGVPTGAYLLYKLTKEHGGIYLLKLCFSKVGDIYREHVAEPMRVIYQELFTKTGRIDVTDRKARIDAIESLKRMIRSWLEESFPGMSVEEQMERAETMDISLIEEKMEESIKHIYELNSVVRMSLIEMQFIKKELLSALVAMDELMGSNEINMRIAAMTPAVIMLMAIRRVFRTLFYSLVKVGKSKEEIYSSFRQTILDIERLLVMRDNPPSPPESLEWGSSAAGGRVHTQQPEQTSQTLSAEDLGMLLLHIHECRNILWQSRRRFGSDVLRNVAEDLAELAGERGPVSVGQQLQIINRMARTYPFMKVVSSGVRFDMIIPG